LIWLSLEGNLSAIRMSELHTISAGGGAAQADVIFVHGLDGGPFQTWQHDAKRQNDCWLYWLANDAPQISVHTLEYAAISSEWLGPAMPLGDRAKEVLNELARRGIGRRPIVFVCHSLGGLLVKQLLRMASEDAAGPGWRPISDQARGVVFVATPHTGADLARTLRRIGWALRTSPAIDDLRPHAPPLRELNEWYRGFVKPRRVRTLCYYETYRTMATRFRCLPLAIKVVEEADADPGVDGARPMPLDADHRSICKPSKKDHQLCHAVLELVQECAGPQTSGPAPTTVNQLPADLPDFEGREAEIEVLEAALRGEGRAAITAIDGMGGVGKSALAVRVAHRLAAEIGPDGVLYVELGGVSERPLTAVDAMTEVVATFAPEAAKPTGEREAIAGFRAALDGRRVLLLLDNARDAGTVAPLFEHRPPGCAILVTSRERIVAPGVTPMALEEMTPGEARKLLRNIVGEARAGDGDLDAIAKHCGWLPLALRVAGTFLARHTNWPVEDYLKALAGERDRLAKLRLKGMPKLDVAAVLGFSARQLAEEDRELAERWQTLAVFVESFDLAAAAAVWEVSADEALEGLGELVAQSMVRFDPDTSRYRLHDLMRDVAQLPLEGQDEDAIPARLEVVRARHARHYCDVLAAAGQLYLKGGEGVFGGLALYDLDQRNIAAGEAWAAARIAKDDVAARLSARYAEVAIDVLALRLHLRELVHWLEEQRRACERLGDRRGESAALGNSASYGGTLASQNEQFGIISRRSKSRARSATGWLRARDLVTWASLGITWVSHDVL
jgi:predicted alpha/beta hydrolase family esterase